MFTCIAARARAVFFQGDLIFTDLADLPYLVLGVTFNTHQIYYLLTFKEMHDVFFS